MRLIPAALALVLSAGLASAQTASSTTNLTCAQARGLVVQQGGVVLGTGGRTFDRFVSNEGLCARELAARQAFAPTLDNPQCPVGFVCVNSDVNVD